MFAALGALCSLAAMVCGIIILIAAFQDEVLQGILCLCVPFYILYYAFAKYQSPNKGIIIAIWLAGAILGNILMMMGGAGAVPAN